MRLGLDLDYRQTNERKLSIQIATCQVYLEPGLCSTSLVNISGDGVLLTLINVRDT